MQCRRLINIWRFKGERGKNRWLKQIRQHEVHRRNQSLIDGLRVCISIATAKFLPREIEDIGGLSVAPLAVDV